MSRRPIGSNIQGNFNHNYEADYENPQVAHNDPRASQPRPYRNNDQYREPEQFIMYDNARRPEPYHPESEVTWKRPGRYQPPSDEEEYHPSSQVRVPVDYKEEPHYRPDRQPISHVHSNEPYYRPDRQPITHPPPKGPVYQPDRQTPDPDEFNNPRQYMKNPAAPNSPPPPYAAPKTLSNPAHLPSHIRSRQPIGRENLAYTPDTSSNGSGYLRNEFLRDNASTASGTMKSATSRKTLNDSHPSLYTQDSNAVAIENTLAASSGRDQWDNKVQYLLAVVGYAVGLGNVWRFPYLAQKHGGGAFLIPYLILLFVEGVPILILELAVGQRFRRSAMFSYQQMSPGAVGIGITMVLSSFGSGVYYNTIICWCIYYVGSSFNSELPWEKCPDSPECRNATPSQFYFYRTTLDIADKIGDSGGLNPYLLLVIVIGWVILFLCVFRGIKSSGKVVYFTATFPYIVLTIFLIRGVTLDGAIDGLVHLFKPNFSKLIDGHVWLDAAAQIFFTLSVAGGGLIAMSSYNRVDNNFFKDALIVAGVNSCTSLYAGCVIFSIVGFMANQKYDACIAKNGDPRVIGPGENSPCDLEKFLSDSVSGTGLAFMTIAEACTKFTFLPSQFWSFLFYFMLITLGLDSMFGILECIITTITDISIFRSTRKVFIVAVLCAVGCLFGILFSFTNGEYALQLCDEYIGSIPLVIIAFSETIIVGWIYGINRFAKDFYVMVGFKPPIVFLFCWKYLSPFIIFVVFIGNIYGKIADGIIYERWEKLTGSTVDTPLPAWAIAICMLTLFFLVIWIPLVAIISSLIGGKEPIFSDEDIPNFPVTELRAKYKLSAYPTNKVERSFLFGITDEYFAPPTVSEKVSKENISQPPEQHISHQLPQFPNPSYRYDNNSFQDTDFI